jgi:HEAT repeat protein
VKRLSPIISAVLAAVLSFGSACTAAEGTTTPVVATPTETDGARQLRIYEEALLRGASEQIRSDAAVELLRRSDNPSWEILLKAIVTKDNSPAREAICRGLIAARTWGKALRNPKPFLEPLVGVLVDGSETEAKLAAEALLIFNYSDVTERLGNLARTRALERQIRLNALYAMSLWPDKEALLEIVNLIDDPDIEIASAAAAALPYWIPPGTAKDTILLQIKDKSSDEIIRARAEGLQSQMRTIEAERNAWRKMYIDTLARDYEKADLTGKGAILVEKMASDLPPVRLWAVRKAGAFPGPYPPTFRDTLLALISDPNRSIRLAAANVLSSMSALDPAVRLLEQIKVEKYSDVKLAIFDALGEACFFAFSPGSGIKLDDSLRTETLTIAVAYLMGPDPAGAAQAAEVIGKLIELNGLPKQDALQYLQSLSARYSQDKDKPGIMRGTLLNVMARLSSAGSYRQTAAEMFGSFFVTGLSVKDDASVREAAALGLVGIDKAVAFRLFKENGAANDNSMLVRRTVIRLAGDLGGVDELGWLLSRVDSNGEAEPAWQAIQNILARQTAAVVLDWGRKLVTGEDKAGRARTLLETAEKKADVDKDAATLLGARRSLVDLYLKKKDYPKVVEYCNLLLASTTDPAQQQDLQVKILDSSLRSANTAKVVEMISAKLAAADIRTEDVYVAALARFFADPDVTAESKTTVLDAISAIKGEETKPNWAAQLALWRQMLRPPGTTSTTATPPPAATITTTTAATENK